jgi:hypothetical protein
MNYLQTFLDSPSYSIFPTSEKNWTHIHIKALLTCLCSFSKHSVKSTLHSYLLFHHKNCTEKYQFSNNNATMYLCLRTLFFQFSVSWSSKMQFGVIYLKTWGSTQHRVAFWTPEFYSCCSDYSGTSTAPSYLTFQIPVFVVLCQICLPGWWMGFASHVLWFGNDASSLSLKLGSSLTPVWTVCIIILNHTRREC